jgi:hypothetical protein
MPVEDIDFLLNNNEKDSFLIFVDSSSRNKSAYPTPSEYEVNFSEPFYNVFGIEILDATVPSTMYTVDSFNNVLSYCLVYLNSKLNDDTFQSLHNNLLEICPAYKELVLSKNLDTNSSHTRIVVYDLNIVNANDDLTKIYSEPEQHDIFYGLGYEEIAIPIAGSSTNTQYATIDGVNLDTSNEQYQKFLPYVGTNCYKLLKKAENEVTFLVASIKKISSDSYIFLSAVEKNPRVVGASKALTYNATSFCISLLHLIIEEGNYDINTFAAYLNNRFANDVLMTYKTNTLVNPTSTPFTILSQDVPVITKSAIEGSMEKQTKYKFMIQNSYVRFFINIQTSTSLDEIGFSSLYGVRSSGQFKLVKWIESFEYISTTPDDENMSIIIPPGIVQLTGQRYMLLRCPEIESHLYNSFAYSRNCPGIGAFKLGSVNQITQLRFDFVNFIKKPFHPIGKLSKLTLRFETTSGLLYDFKGVDHNLLISVKFYVPKRQATTKYILNPNYTPNFSEYMISKLERENEENDVIEQLKLDRANDLIKEQNKWDYSSGDESDDPSEISFS